MRSPGVSVIICCHNSAERLPVTLQHLARQCVTGVRWEVLVVDNASTDNTAEVARQWWHDVTIAPLRVVSEPTPGLAHARLCGLAAARYEFLSYIDDDNWVCPEWVQLVAEVMVTRPEVGVLGSASFAEPEVKPPVWFNSCSLMFAIAPSHWQAGDITDSMGAVWGAGMTIRRSAWEGVRAAAPPQLLLGRLKGSLAGGEDNEICYQLRLAGWRIWYEPRLQLKHYLPSGRLTWPYLLRLYRGSGEAVALLLPYFWVMSTVCTTPEETRAYEWGMTLLYSLWFFAKFPLRWTATIGDRKERNHLWLDWGYHTGRIFGLLQSRSSYREKRKAVQEFSRRVSRVSVHV